MADWRFLRALVHLAQDEAGALDGVLVLAARRNLFELGALRR